MTQQWLGFALPGSRSKNPVLAALCLALCMGTGMTGQALALGKDSAAPVFELSGMAVADAKVKLADYRGKLVYLDFWASWCGPCRKSFPWMNSMQEKYGAQGLQVIGINLDSKSDDAREFLAATPARFVLGFDPGGTTPRSYGVKGMPTSFLIDAEGKVLLQHSGFNDGERGELENRIKQALGVAK